MSRAGDQPRRFAEGPVPSPGSAEELVVAFLRAARPYRTPRGRRERLEVVLAGAHRARPFRSLLKLGFAMGLLVCGAATVSAHLLDWPRWLAARLPGREASVGRRAAPASSAPAARPAPVSAEAAKEEPLKEEPPVVPPPPPVAAAAPAPEPTPAPIATSIATWAPVRRHRHRVRVAKASGESTTVDEAAEPPSAETTSKPQPEAAPKPQPEAAPRPQPGAAPKPQPAPPKASRDSTAEEDAAMALAALTALRRDHDPVRARAMVDAYLRAHPAGSMAEEALAISIEAASTHHDADAKALAARYLSLYPSGTFRALARKTLR